MASWNAYDILVICQRWDVYPITQMRRFIEVISRPSLRTILNNWTSLPFQTSRDENKISAIFEMHSLDGSGRPRNPRCGRTG
jgi:hypothetical protein